MTREEVLLSTRSKLQAIGLPKLKAEVGKYFFNMDPVVEALYIALTSGFNIILYGPGGFGKTQVVKKFIEVSGLSSSTIVGYEDMEVDGLLGVVDIKKLTEEAIYEIKFENSVFANPGILILEEFLDARPSTAAALKDILTEGGYRRGESFIESLISSVIICTNKSPEEVSTSNSTAAFYKERFPIVVHVTWAGYTFDHYLQYLKHIKPEAIVKFKDFYYIIAELAARTSAKGSIVSPRIVKYASDLIDLHQNLSCLTNLAGLDTTEIDVVTRECETKAKKRQIKELVGNVNFELDKVKSIETYSVTTISEALGKLDYILNRLDTITAVDSDNFEQLAKLRTDITTLIEQLTKKIDRTLVVSERKAIDKLFGI